MPYVIYDNTDMKEAVRIIPDGSVDTSLTVKRTGAFVRSGVEVADEIDIFQGNQNPMTMSQDYTKDFQCEYQLHRYPFDTQVCSINMIVKDLDVKTIQLLPKEIFMKSKTELTTYVITHWELRYNNVSDKERGLQMEIVLKRRIMNELLTTYLPSILLILITYATTFFKPFYFEAALTVNLTTMLVMTTLFIAVMGKLPSTAYIKMVDYWLIFGQLIPFLEVGLLSLTIKCKQNQKNNNTTQLA